MKLSLFDIIAYLNSRHVNFSTEGKNVTPGWVNISCLFCADDSNHLGINISSGRYSCWKCGRSGPASDIVKVLDNCMSRSMAEGIMEDYIKTNFSTISAEKIPSHFKPLEYLPYDIVPSNIKKWITTQNISLRSLKEFSSGYTLDHPDMGHRIIFEVTYKYQVVSYVGRDYTELQSNKYKNYPNEISIMPIKHTLFGYDSCYPGNPIIVVEGIKDQMKLGNGAVATYGTKFTKEQIQRLYEKKPSKIFVIYDSEEEAQKQAAKLCSNIWFCPTEIIELTKVNDPGELSEEEGIKLKQILLNGN